MNDCRLLKMLIKLTNLIMRRTVPKKYDYLPYSTIQLQTTTAVEITEVCSLVSKGVGSLDDLELSLDNLNLPLASSLVRQVFESSCKSEAPTRRLLRFFSWSMENLESKLEDKDYNLAIQVFSERKDLKAVEILMSDLVKQARSLNSSTFSLVAETLVKHEKEDEALGIFKNLDKFNCPHDVITVTAIVNALCAKGHAKRAEGVFLHHKDKIAGSERLIYRSLIYGWSQQCNVKESRRILQEMKSAGFVPDIFCFNEFLRCLCERNLKSNPSVLLPEALNVLREMRSYGLGHSTTSYNIILSCLGKVRRVKESLQVLERMRKTGCFPDSVSYYLVARVLYLTGRFGKGNEIVNYVIEMGLVEDHKFFYNVIGILCGVERVNYAIEVFDKMKSKSLGGYGPVYDLLIPKLCRGGDFDKGRELWDEARSMGVCLSISSEVLDPLITKVFEPVRKEKKKVTLMESRLLRLELKERSRKSKKKK
ncbi:pentatricopeptide repeat-containing protein At5g61370, mitochondrial [Impatiens glandulifera]|uniref:pentatricopeptide repeat-containing protein At5g61370, mitochondrial n=1 Tax=Impatiens glandulifera TaxID=253017 RepID=UPI001FB06D37|nr:pentatricopeptide repeat-containing protein At5g61370, mitochondrial [Impatiens glandulifera]XP_047329590.1 pentatricopeptide repeat-containing protein At5g61370, mitochondrial [Impatiens glandulifera]